MWLANRASCLTRGHGTNVATPLRRRFGQGIAEFARRAIYGTARGVDHARVTLPTIRDGGRVALVTQSRGTGATHITSEAGRELEELVVSSVLRIRVENSDTLRVTPACLP